MSGMCEQAVTPDFYSLCSLKEAVDEQVTVVGGGVGILIGRALQQVGCEVTIYDAGDPRASDVAGAQWLPLVFDDQKSRQHIEAGADMSFAQYMAWSGDPSVTGVRPAVNIEPVDDSLEWPAYLADLVHATKYGLTEPIRLESSNGEIHSLDRAYAVPSFAINATRLLSWQTQAFRERGGKIIQRRITSESLASQDGKVIVAAGQSALHLFEDIPHSLERGFTMDYLCPDGVPIIDRDFEGEMPILSSDDLIVCVRGKDRIRIGAPHDHTLSAPSEAEMDNLERRVQAFASQPFEQFPGIAPEAFTIRTGMQWSQRVLTENGIIIENRELSSGKEVTAVTGLGSIGISLFPYIAQEATRVALGQ